MPATNPEVWFSTCSVCVIEVMVPVRNARRLLAVVRSAPLMPGSCVCVSCAVVGAAGLNPNVSAGKRPAKLYGLTLIFCRLPPNWSWWSPAT